MALSKPILNLINAFDATKAQTFTFNSIGGSQVVKNKLVISLNTTGTQVYSQEQTTFKFEHIVAANSLENDKYYSAVLYTYDASGNVSPVSNTIQFHTYATPTLTFTNIPSTNIINNSSYSFNVQYNQANSEPLNSYIFNLYDFNKNVISTSGELYTGTTTVPLTFSYLFNGFQDSTTYYIDVSGVTLNGTQVSSDLVEFTADYATPAIFSSIELTNNCKDGYINITNNLVVIEGTSNPTPPTYINHEAIDLTKKGSWVKWESGYSINGDFTLGVWGYKFNPNTQIVYMGNKNDSGETPFKLIINHKETYFELYCYNGNDVCYYAYSNTIAKPKTTDNIFMWVRRVNNIFELKYENRSVG